jgi:hypothetical protein
MLDKCYGLTAVLVLPSLVKVVGESEPSSRRMKQIDFGTVVIGAASSLGLVAQVQSVTRLSIEAAGSVAATTIPMEVSSQQYLTFDEPLVVKVLIQPIPLAQRVARANDGFEISSR